MVVFHEVPYRKKLINLILETQLRTSGSGKIEKETDVISLLWMAGQLDERDDTFLIQIIKQVQRYDLLVIGNLN